MKIGPLTIEWKTKKRQILDVLKESKIKAIKETMVLYGWKLRQAKAYVDKLEEKHF